MENQISGILGGVALAAVTGLFAFVWKSNSIIIELKMKVDILYRSWEDEVKAAIGIIHKPHAEAKELDDLLDKFRALMNKFSNQTLSDEELIRLIELLTNIKNNDAAASGDRMAAHKVLNYIEMRYKLMQLGV